MERFKSINSPVPFAVEACVGIMIPRMHGLGGTDLSHIVQRTLRTDSFAREKGPCGSDVESKGAFLHSESVDAGNISYSFAEVPRAVCDFADNLSLDIRTRAINRALLLRWRNLGRTAGRSHWV